jgi:hypothetical protein
MNQAMFETRLLALCLAYLDFFWCGYGIRLMYHHKLVISLSCWQSNQALECTKYLLLHSLNFRGGKGQFDFASAFGCSFRESFVWISGFCAKEALQCTVPPPPPPKKNVYRLFSG